MSMPGTGKNGENPGGIFWQRMHIAQYRTFSMTISSPVSPAGITSNQKIRVGLADDQQLFLKSLATLINSFGPFDSCVEASNGEDLLRKLELGASLPDILLLDVNMPVLDGIATAGRIAEKYPLIKLVALSMKDDDITVISMLRAGCCAYLLKDIHPDELEKALLEINAHGYYNADVANVNFRRLLLHDKAAEQQRLKPQELAFLKLACTELTYRQIANEMHLSERTIDGYREALFEKLNVQSRVGMAMEAIRRGIVEL